MARILCNVAGGGKPLKGNAKTGDVLAGKTFSNKQSNALTGSMPNNGAWSASTSGNGSVTIPAGYHNGSGTVSGAASYNSGYANGRQLHWVDLGYGGNGNYNATGVPNYGNLSDTNFVFQVTQAEGSGGYNGSGTTGHGFDAGSSCSCYPSVSYNPSNGIATVTGCSGSKSEDHHTTYEYGRKYANVSVSGRLWCVYTG